MNVMKKVATVADRLQEALDVRNMRQADLARETGIAKGTISNWITGKYEPKAQSIAKLATTIDCSDLWLMGFDVPMDRRAYVDPDDLEFVNALAANIKPVENLSPELAAVDTLIRPLGYNIIKIDGSYFVGECGELTETEMNEILNTIIISAKTALDLIKAKRHKEMMDFFSKP